MVAPSRGSRAAVTRGDAGDVRPVEGGEAVERQFAACAGAGPWKASCGDHLRRRKRALTLGKTGRVGIAAWSEERVRVVDAVVDDPDLDAGTGDPRRGREGRGADQARAAVQRQLVAQAGEELGDERHRAQTRQPPVRELDRDAVEDDLEAARDAGGGDRGADGADRRGLSGVDPRQVCPRRTALDVEAL
jgi:hypothetical protein